jgi:hypothetical protein
MASFEDYDEFGNYIGADLDSDDEDIPQNHFLREQASGSAAPLEGYEDEPMRGEDEEDTMDVDGERCRSLKPRRIPESQSQSHQHITRSFSMRINSTTLQHRMCMGRVSRLSFRKRTRNLYPNPLLHLSKCGNGLSRRRICQRRVSIRGELTRPSLLDCIDVVLDFC